jgi:hypothetical protein
MTTLIQIIKERIIREWRLTLAELYPPELWRMLVQAAKDTWKDIKELLQDADK